MLNILYIYITNYYIIYYYNMYASMYYSYLYSFVTDIIMLHENICIQIIIMLYGIILEFIYVTYNM